MKRSRMAGLVTLAWLVAGCGDNSKECGPGTVDKDGVCTPDECGPGTIDDGMNQCVPDGSVLCTNGTKFDAPSGRCVIDPLACQGGTVLVAGACVDPGKVHADLEEGQEPNGLGILGETSAAPAGVIVLPPVGTGFVLHGHITPFQDLNGDGQDDPDIDSYRVAVTGPTLVTISADGVGGLAAGFVVVAAVANTSPLFQWQRLGINFEGDTSKRQVLLPAAGTYLLGIADTRSLTLGAAAGTATTEYYVTVTAAELPAPLTIDLSQGVVGSVTGAPKFFAPGPLGSGMTDLRLAMPLRSAKASLLVFDQNMLLSFADETTLPADVAFANPPGSSTMIVVDFVYNYALEPADFALSATRTP